MDETGNNEKYAQKISSSKIVPSMNYSEDIINVTVLLEEKNDRIHDKLCVFFMSLSALPPRLFRCACLVNGVGDRLGNLLSKC